MRTLLALALLTGCKGGDPTEPTEEPTPTDVPTPVVDDDQDGWAAEEDCNDADASVHPEATELCDGVDQDCDGVADDGLTFADWFVDADGDGFGTGTATSACAPVTGAVQDGSDCDDTNASVNPGAIETCDGIDEDCSGTADDGLTFTDWFVDADLDGYGAGLPTSACAPIAGSVEDGTDCNDADADVSPAAIEVCDGIDQDCDDAIDEGVLSTFSVDLDLDGYGTDVLACADPDGAGTEVPGDCDDGDASAYPGAVELCDGVDTACDGRGEHVVPAAFASIQGAVDAASAGDVVCIAAGTYTENLVVDVDLTLEGVGSAQVVVDGDLAGRVLDVTSGATQIALSGLTLRNGLASTGAGMRASGVSVTLEDVVIRDNACLVGPCMGVGANLSGTLVMDDVVFQDNTATIPNDANLVGVGLHASSGTLTGTDVQFLGNVGVSVGSIWIAGAGFYFGDLDVTMTDTVVRGNTLTGGQTRGHAFATDGGSLLFERIVVEGNVAAGDTWPYPAKGAVHVGSPMVFRNGLVVDNEATGQPGSSVLGNAFTAYGSHEVVIEHSTVAGNIAPGAWSSLMDGNSSNITLSNLVLSDNDGGAVMYGSGTVTSSWLLVNESGVANVTGTGVLLDLDPLFQSDWTLGAGSPAIDAGDPNVLDTDGTRADLGYFGGPAAP
ncbi:MAG: hypothetical protein H6736_20450 [Alphaproteobacteria bacterium]|nr:hypothetical protein [Alphaproteobacteria bacterium]